MGRPGVDEIYLTMKCVDDYRLRLGDDELVPIMIGGMGVDISTMDLALEAATPAWGGWGISPMPWCRP